ncbi:CaiB/BaiF CoA transferase family protein [Salicibibacter kimchii]|nr:CoA transferase [Salicibibacter kimchii]
MPLKDIRIIDLSRLLSGPYATMMLSDLGAEVIKVESPSGDDTRQFGPPYYHEWSSYFLSVNRNKKSISLDLKTEQGKDVLLKMIRTADVVIENFRPGTMERLGLSYETMKEYNPKIILASISGFGQYGSYSKKPGYDVLAQAMGGLMSVTGEKNGEPLKAGYSFADLGTGMWAAFGIMTALWERNKSGEGQWIDAALLDTIISWQTYLASNYFATGEDPKALGTEHPNIVPYQAFQASDGHFVIAIARDHMWHSFTAKIGIDILKDGRFNTNEGRVIHRNELIPLLENVFIQRSRQEWDDFFTDIGVPVGPVNKLSEILDDKHVKERDMVVNTKHQRYGETKSLGFPIQLSRTPGKIRSFPPELGEHTESILNDLGYDKEDIKSFLENGVVFDRTKVNTK